MLRPLYLVVLRSHCVLLSAVRYQVHIQKLISFYSSYRQIALSKHVRMCHSAKRNESQHYIVCEKQMLCSAETLQLMSSRDVTKHIQTGDVYTYLPASPALTKRWCLSYKVVGIIANHCVLCWCHTNVRISHGSVVSHHKSSLMTREMKKDRHDRLRCLASLSLVRFAVWPRVQ